MTRPTHCSRLDCSRADFLRAERTGSLGVRTARSSAPSSIFDADEGSNGERRRHCWPRRCHEGAGSRPIADETLTQVRENARVEAYVAVTDGDWYRFLARRTDLNEVNFWRPGGGRGFHRIAVGEPFFFKTHHPHNRVVGGGFYSGFAPLKVSEAWDLFGHANGVQDLDQMRHRVGQGAHRHRC
jgi:hypothetical protein